MASTYSDLKIELIGTGEQTGTWGSTTNNNFSVAFQEAITGSADVAFSSADVTVTLTDTNASQTARNLRLNLTGTSGGARQLILGSGCQIEKLYLINNGLADAVTVKNTTGTGIAVPAGKTMFVYNNGTNVVDATTHLTSLTTGALSASGAVTFTAGTASTSTTTGTAVITGGLGVSGRINAANFDGIVGANTAAAGNFTTLSATGVATFSAGTVSAPAITTTVDTNTGIFFPAADTIAFTEGGTESMRIDSSGRVLIGSTSASGSNLLQVTGDASISGLTVGKGGGAVSNNTVVGLNAGVANTTGKITAIGYLASRFNTTGSGNTAVGGNDGAQDGALYLNTTGNYNIAMGTGAVASNTTGSSNTGIGYSALQNNTTASNNTAVGYQALYSTTTSGANTALGYQAGYSNTTGTQHTLLGRQAGYSLTTSTNNVNVGFAAGYSNQTGDGVIAIGAACLYNNTASYNTAVGAGNTMYANTTGSSNVAIGGNDGTANATMRFNTTGSYNTAIGIGSLGNNTTASNNTAVGYQAGYSNTTGATNTFVARLAGYNNTTGSINTFIGDSSGYLMTTGSKNCILGSFSGNQSSLDIRTASNYIVLSDGDGNPRLYSDGSGRIRIGGFSGGNDIFRALQTTANTTATFENSNATPTGASVYFSGASPNNTTQDFFNCGDTTNAKLYIYSNGTVTNRTGTYNSFSDIKLKQDIVDAGSQWNDIKSVRVRKFRLKDDVLTNPESKPLIGVIAQELELTSAGLVEDCTERDGQTTKAVKYSILYMKAVKALQEAMERIEVLEAKVQQLENK